VEKVQLVMRKLRYPSTQVNTILSACRLWKDLPWVATAKLSLIARRLEDVPPLAIYANFLAARDDNICNNLQAYLDRLNSIKPGVSGDDLRKRGLPPGPVYKRILGALRDAWLDGKIEDNFQEQTFLEELIRNETGIHPAS
jgi:tRNA nucleotidyltransferase (CCA-adding enzyme)